MILMKIIIKDETGIKKCLIQLRDVDYMEKKYNAKSIRKYLTMGIHSELKEESFIPVVNAHIAQVIEADPNIVDFSEIVKLDTLSISRLIVLAHSFGATKKQQLDEEKKTIDLQDIMSFKNGTLDYKIPLMLDGKVMNKDGEIVFGSTTIPGCYVLKGNKHSNLREYLELNSNALYSLIGLDKEMESYSVTELDNCLLVHFNTKKKRITK